MDPIQSIARDYEWVHTSPNSVTRSRGQRPGFAVGVDKREAETEKALDMAENKVVKRVEKGDLSGAYDAALTGAAKAEDVARG